MSGLGYDMPIYRLFWNALKPPTRKTYSAATRSFEIFCEYHRRSPYPVRRVVLVHCISGRMYGKYDSLIKKQTQVRPATASAYIAALRSVHIDLDLPSDLLDGLHVRRLVSGAFGTFPQQKPQQRIPITRALLLRLFDPAAAKGETPADTLNLNIELAFALAGFMGKFTHLAVDVECNDCVHTKLTVRYLTISPDSDHLQLLLPRS
ncbi:hypothetical protein E4U17_001248 [Claviceps sp. LM77 group G4]|nr:hypothetical protein E4U17_001248 [Claviceps sp. LM77 group G4]